LSAQNAVQDSRVICGMYRPAPVRARPPDGSPLQPTYDQPGGAYTPDDGAGAEEDAAGGAGVVGTGVDVVVAVIGVTVTMIG
jgi:hypothetical protein